MKKQVKDARNVVYKQAEDPSLYPEQFNWAGRTLEKSLASMEKRKMKIAGWIGYYLGLSGHSLA